MKEFKGTKGEWGVNYVSGIPIGVNAEISQNDLGVYSQNICEIILPDTDEEWEDEKAESTANLKLIAAAPELLEAVQYLLNAKDDGSWNKQAAESFARDAVNKALGN